MRCRTISESKVRRKNKKEPEGISPFRLLCWKIRACLEGESHRKLDQSGEILLLSGNDPERGRTEALPRITELDSVEDIEELCTELQVRSPFWCDRETLKY